MASKKKLRSWLKRHKHEDYFMTEEQQAWQQECDNAYISHEVFQTKSETVQLSYLYQAYEDIIVNGVLLKVGNYLAETALKWLDRDSIYFKEYKLQCEVN